MAEQRGFDWKTAVELSSAVAAALYAYGWILIARFLGRFKVSPEEVGVGFAYVLVRLAIVVMVFAALVGGLWWLLGRAAGREPVIKLPPGPAARIVRGALAVLTAVLTVLVTGGLAAIPLLAAVVASVGAYLTGSARGERAAAAGATGAPGAPGADGAPAAEHHPVPIRLGPLLQASNRLLIVVAAVSFVVSPFFAGDSLARRLQRGKEVTPEVFGIPALTVRRVQVAPAGDVEVPDGCVLYVGSNDGVSVFYEPDNDHVLRLPDEQIAVRSPCP